MDVLKQVYKVANDFIIKEKDGQTEILTIRWNMNYQQEEFQDNP